MVGAQADHGFGVAACVLSPHTAGELVDVEPFAERVAADTEPGSLTTITATDFADRVGVFGREWRVGHKLMVC